MGDIKFEIIEEVGVLSTNSKGWKKEINKISWNGAKAKYDIRDWSPDHEKMGKGVTLTDDELQNLLALFGKEEPAREVQEEPIAKSQNQSGEQTDNSIDDLYKRWNDLCKHAPMSIRADLEYSKVDNISENRVVVIVKKGSYDRIVKDQNKKMLDGFISHVLERNVQVELIESSLV